MLEMIMGNTMRKALECFSDDLTANVGKDLACSIINYAKLPNELEAGFLKTDRLTGLEGETKKIAAIDLLEYYLNT